MNAPHNQEILEIKKNYAHVIHGHKERNQGVVICYGANLLVSTNLTPNALCNHNMVMSSSV